MVTHTILLFLLTAQAVNQPMATGLKISVQYSSDRQPPRQNITYIENDRRRSEYRNSSGNVDGPLLASLLRCNLGQNFELNLEDRQYVSAPLPRWPSKEELQRLAAKSPPPAEPKKPKTLLEISTADTGERKMFFGYEARHVITTRKRTRLDGGTEGNSESVTDGWYTDLSTTPSCEPKSTGRVGYARVAVLTAGRLGQPLDVPTIKVFGKPEEGFALSTKTTDHNTIALPDGSKKDFTSASEMQVTELYSGPLDSSLFEVPSGFKKVDEIRRNPPIPLSLRMQEYWNAFKLKVSRLFHR